MIKAHWTLRTEGVYEIDPKDLPEVTQEAIMRYVAHYARMDTCHQGAGTIKVAITFGDPDPNGSTGE